MEVSVFEMLDQKSFVPDPGGYTGSGAGGQALIVESSFMFAAFLVLFADDGQ